MISKTQVIQANPSYKTLINAVYNRIGKDSIMDVVKYGIDGGFSGFIYYTDTHTFAMRYRAIIVRLLEEQASELGEDVVSMIASFGAFKRSPDDKKDLYKYLGGGRPQQGAITNAMAWFAAEEVCRMFDN